MPERTKPSAVWLAVGAAGLWGLTEALSKYILNQSPPMPILLVQLSSSLLVSWMVVAIRFPCVEINRNTAIGWSLGVLHPGISNSLGFVGLSHVGASVSSAIWALEAIITMLAARVILGERMSFRQSALSALSLVGVLMASGSFEWDVAGSDSLYGVAALLIAVLGCGLFGALSRQVAEIGECDELVLVAGQQITGLLWICLMIPLSRGGTKFHELANLTAGDWLVCVATGFIKFPLATGLFLTSLRFLSASQASRFLVLSPLFGIGAALLLLGESISPLQSLGVTILLLSVWAVQYPAFALQQ